MYRRGWAPLYLQLCAPHYLCLRVNYLVVACIQLSSFGVWASLKLCCAAVLLLSCAVPGEVLSSCGVETLVLSHHVVWLFSSCSLLAHLYLSFEGLLSRSGVEPPLSMWCMRLLHSMGRVWGLLS